MPRCNACTSAQRHYGERMSAHEHDRPILALVIRLLGIAGLAAMAALIKLAATHGLHLIELLFWRQFLALPILLGWAMMQGGLGMLGTKRPKAQILRGISGLIGMIPGVSKMKKQIEGANLDNKMLARQQASVSSMR